MRNIRLGDFKSLEDLHEVLGYKFKLRHPKRDWKKFKLFIEICRNLPCTRSVLSRRLKLSEPTVYSRLNELVGWGMVEKRIDQECFCNKYYLTGEYIHSEKRVAEAVLSRLHVEVKRFRRGKAFERKKVRKLSKDEEQRLTEEKAEMFRVLVDLEGLVYDEEIGWIRKSFLEAIKKSGKEPLG